MSKIFICGIVSSEAPLEEIHRSAAQFISFDGAVWVVNYPTDDYSNTDVYDILVANKGCGRILKAPWVFNHSLSRNIYLNSGVFKEGDFIFSPDIQEIFQPDFLANIRAIVDDWEKQDITGIAWGRVYAFKYSSGLEYRGSPHEFLHNLRGKIASVQDESKVVYHENSVEFGNFIFNHKDFTNSMLMSSVKYSLCYEVSNESLNQFGKFGNEVVREQELKRYELRKYLQSILGKQQFSLDDIVNYWKSQAVLQPKMLDYIENDDQLKTLYRLKILCQTRQEILTKRYDYSVRGTLEYISNRNILNKNFGFPVE